jgi:hypothetical protein
MMDLMNVFVERAPMKSSVGPIVERIFHDEEDCDLPCYCPRVRKGNVNEQAKVLDNRMEEVYLR